jgi:SAM-dependent methyltransferase
MLDATARAEDAHFWFRGLRRNAARFLDRALGGRRGVRILDCGAGTGRNLDWLTAFGSAIGVELSTTGLDLGRARRARLVRASVTHLPFPNASMDVCTSFDVLYCLDDEAERRAVQEMWRVLRPGGVALVNTAALDVLRGAHSTLTHERRRYSRASLRRLLASTGFVVERLTFTNMATFPVTLAVRWADRVTGRADTGSDADLRVPAAPINSAFDALLAAEGALLQVVDLPIGSSLLCVARKPGGRPGSDRGQTPV